MPTTLASGPLVFWFVTLTVKHIIADFPLQTQWMVLGKDGKTNWLKPLVVHCAIHGLLAALVIGVIEPRFWWLGSIDFAVHCVVDRCKGLWMQRFDLSPANSQFWTVLGTDQALHHLTGFALAIVLAS